jgi:Zn-dependent protease
MRLGTSLAVIFLILIVVAPVAALDLKTVDIVVDSNGDALMKVSYSNNLLETAAIATNYGGMRQKVENRFSDAIGKDTSTRCIGPGSTVFSIRNFADMSGNAFTTPRMDLGKIPDGLGYSFGFIGVGDVSPDITIAFPDNTSRQFSQSTIIPLVTYTLRSDGVTRGPPVLPDEMQCGTPADLIAVKKPFAAVATGIAVAVIAGNMAAGAAATANTATAQSAFMGKITAFFQKLFGNIVTSRFSTEEMKRRKISAVERNSVFLGFSAIEILAAVTGAVIFGVSFMVAKGSWLDPTTFSIFFIVSGFGIAIHEMAHRFVASRNKGISEFKFWELGTVIMLVTGALFGLVFAKPYRTVISNAATLEKRSLGIIMLAGPVISVVLALLFLTLIPLGGIYSDIGTAGFSVNLLSAVYAMMPFNPMDGEKIYSWSHARWAVVFVPLFLFYLLILLH